jgi:hypothetical protein
MMLPKYPTYNFLPSGRTRHPDQALLDKVYSLDPDVLEDHLPFFEYVAPENRP